MAKYIKKPVAIEAVKYNGFENLGQPEDVFTERPTWLNYAISMGDIILDESNGLLMVRTSNGFTTVDVGDYIIKGISDMYPCKPDTFDLLYDITPATLGGILDDQR